MASDSRDWSQDKRDAWIYGIVFGWDEAFDEVANRHKWSIADQNRLKYMRNEFKSLIDQKP